MIKENVPAAEADKLVQQGGRVLYLRQVEGKVVCDVEMPGGDTGKVSKMAERAKTHGERDPGEGPEARLTVEDDSDESGSDDA